ncbi:hypothetical protein D9619_011422 [Psilocybe cf. subviscida]|uniref:Uncharacterized protein n=1 Tax=Psilocybe cf. subviscida TaxID=2480587 RepID=A0A8H5BJ84_9AGAR|nr:hypothetical protein D9619_011422 [Psilocybe cf. subviscida]
MTSALLQDLVQAPTQPNETLPTSTEGTALATPGEMIPYGSSENPAIRDDPSEGALKLKPELWNDMRRVILPTPTEEVGEARLATTAAGIRCELRMVQLDMEDVAFLHRKKTKPKGWAIIELVNPITNRNNSSNFKTYTVTVRAFAICDFNHEFLCKTLRRSLPPQTKWTRTNFESEQTIQDAIAPYSQLSGRRFASINLPPVVPYAYASTPPPPPTTSPMRRSIPPALQEHTLHADVVLLGLSVAEIVGDREGDRDEDRGGPSTERISTAPNGLSDVEDSYPTNIHSDVSSENGLGGGKERELLFLAVPVGAKDTVNAPGRPTTIGYSDRSDFDAPYLDAVLSRSIPTMPPAYTPPVTVRSPRKRWCPRSIEKQRYRPVCSRSKPIRICWCDEESMGLGEEDVRWPFIYAHSGGGTLVASGGFVVGIGSDVTGGLRILVEWCFGVRSFNPSSEWLPVTGDTSSMPGTEGLPIAVGSMTRRMSKIISRDLNSSIGGWDSISVYPSPGEMSAFERNGASSNVVFFGMMVLLPKPCVGACQCGSQERGPQGGSFHATEHVGGSQVAKMLIVILPAQVNNPATRL